MLSLGELTLSNLRILFRTKFTIRLNFYYDPANFALRRVLIFVATFEYHDYGICDR